MTRISFKPMHIRQLALADALPYQALRLRMLRINPDAFTSSYEEDVKKPLSWTEQRLVPGRAAADDFVLGAFDDSGQLTGSIGLSIEARQKQRHKGFVFGMYVAPEFAAQGIGRALLAACIARAHRIAGLEQLYLTVTASNVRAVKLYEAAGFTTFGIEERAIRIGDEYFAKSHMTLSLISLRDR